VNAATATARAIGPAVLLRPIEQGDLHLVLSSWLRSNRDGPIARLLPDSVYYAEEKSIVTALVQRVPVVVACNPELRDSVYGWLCGERLEGRLVVHFIYVRHSWRGWGIGRQLLGAMGYAPPEPIIATHVTRLYTGGRLSRSYHVINNPYLALRRAGGLPC
jgi:GNAT superfamily N-acetyltransferase